jgi:hypothetical protein
MKYREDQPEGGGCGRERREREGGSGWVEVEVEVGVVGVIKAWLISFNQVSL